MLTLKQWIESRLATALRELDEAKYHYRQLEEAARAIENGKEPGPRVRRTYQDWLGLQPKESASHPQPGESAGEKAERSGQ